MASQHLHKGPVWGWRGASGASICREMPSWVVPRQRALPAAEGRGEQLFLLPSAVVYISQQRTGVVWDAAQSGMLCCSSFLWAGSVLWALFCDSRMSRMESCDVLGNPVRWTGGDLGSPSR